jgi:triosephosphate isomerase
LEDGQVAGIMLAYEPVWAIGTGRTATPADASEIHGVLRRALVSRVGDKVAAGIPILYGGSVNRGNASQLLAAPDVDGLLVGGASLDADSWASIVRA